MGDTEAVAGRDPNEVWPESIGLIYRKYHKSTEWGRGTQMIQCGGGGGGGVADHNVPM